MDKLLEYHMEDTSKKFDELKEDLRNIKEKLDTMSEFKIQMIATSRTVSFIVSAICGAVTLLVSVFTLKH